jgi:hypothetical protein
VVREGAADDDDADADEEGSISMTQRVMKKDAKKGQQFKEGPGSTVTYTYREEGEGDGSDRSQVVK